MKILKIFIALSFLMISCNKQEPSTMLVKGEIKDLKKGTLFLQKMRDTLLVTVDSVKLEGVGTFTLSDKIESAELYFLSLDKIPGKQLSFFGEQGTITINTKLDKFVLGATINGLTNQQLLDEYNAMKSQFINKRLELIKEDLEAKQSQDSHIIDSIENQIENLIKKRYYYTANFAITHADSEIAPYLALTELFDANIKLLDTINNSLSSEVKASKYGKQLDQYITDIKSKE
ncbi:MAG: DUF4369 domain-containing protein [Flavobacteriaceae bacterium]|nr:DUF4369 domain-containing protein [Flavobacteriaceae bacterium]